MRLGLLQPKKKNVNYFFVNHDTSIYHIYLLKFVAHFKYILKTKLRYSIFHPIKPIYHINYVSTFKLNQFNKLNIRSIFLKFKSYTRSSQT